MKKGAQTRKHRQPKLRRCFISAPFGQKVDSVIKALTATGIEAHRFDSLRPGASITESLLREIRRSDLVCAILPEQVMSASVFYEIGLAVGLGLPVIVLAETTASLPFDLAQLPVGRISFADSATIDRAIRAMLPRVKPAVLPRAESAQKVVSSGGTELRPPSPQRKKLSAQLFDPKQVNARLDALRAHGSSGFQFENLIAGLFAEAGFLVSSERQEHDRGVDLALWLDEITPVIRNPVLVECKTDLSGYEKWSAAEAQLRQYLSVADATCGVLISLNPLPANIPRYTSSIPMVVTFSATDIIRFIATRELGRELVRRRNAAVHGLS